MTRQPEKIISSHRLHIPSIKGNHHGIWDILISVHFWGFLTQCVMHFSINSSILWSVLSLMYSCFAYLQPEQGVVGRRGAVLRRSQLSPGGGRIKGRGWFSRGSDQVSSCRHVVRRERPGHRGRVPLGAQQTALHLHQLGARTAGQRHQLRLPSHQRTVRILVRRCV